MVFVLYWKYQHWTLANLISEKMELAQFFSIYCNDCGWNQKYFSSKECSRDSNSLGRNSFDLNKRGHLLLFVRMVRVILQWQRFVSVWIYLHQWWSKQPSTNWTVICIMRMYKLPHPIINGRSWKNCLQ